MNGLSRLFFLTGQPGMGKTSVLLKAVFALNVKGFDTGGMVSRELRENGIRMGFEIVDLKTGRKGWLAHVNQPTGPRISKYRVNIKDLDMIGSAAILKAVRDADVIVVDEIGPMELFSTRFREAVRRGMESGKPMIGTIHQRARDSLINKIKTREEATILEITHENRKHLHTILVNRVLQFTKYDA